MLILEESLLNIKNLKVKFESKNEIIKAVDGVSLTVNKGETVGLVGESGSGKSITSLTAMGLNKDGITEGEIEYKNIDLLKLAPNKMREFRGKELAMIFQEPMTALNPVFTIGNQLFEAIKAHNNLSKKEVKKLAVELLSKVGIPRPEEVIKDYPHKLSGGMRQRVLIAIAISCNPNLLIADEPTTALDVTIQAEILDLITDLKDTQNMSMLLITHDLGVVANTCTRVYIMYSGIIVETGTVYEIFNTPKHPYTHGLIKSVPTTEEKETNRLFSIKGKVPSTGEIVQGCPFAPRCDYVMDICRRKMPLLEEISPGHSTRCWLHQEDKNNRGEKNYETTTSQDK